MKRYLHGPMGYAKTLKLRFRVGTDALLRKRRQAGECKMGGTRCEMRKIDEGDREKLGTTTVDTSERTIAILEDRWWPQTAKQKGDKTSKMFLYVIC